MLSELDVIVGGALAAFLSGLVGLMITSFEMRRRRSHAIEESAKQAWEHHSSELARNLLVLETVGDEIESTPIDVAVRARLTPSEMQQAAEELSTMGLIDQPSPNVIRLTSAGREVLATHRIEFEESLLNRTQRQNAPSPRPSPEELDVAIGQAVAVLRTQHAHS